MEKDQFDIGEFHGPLDLLLFLIRKSEINIYDIPISDITVQYIKVIDSWTDRNLEGLSDFYLMISTLLYIKSRMLLPVEVDIDEEAEDPRTDLVAKLIDYQKFKKISELMKTRLKKRELKEDTIRPKRQILYNDDIWEEVEVSDLFKTYKSIKTINNREKIVNLDEDVTINEKIVLIDEFLENRNEFYFMDLIKDKESVMEFVCAFLAILDSIKYHIIKVYQNKQYGTILLKKGKGDSE